MESTPDNLEEYEMMFHFIPDTETSFNFVGEDVKGYVNRFLVNLCSGYDVQPTSIGLIGDLSTLTNIIGVVVQDYHYIKTKGKETINP